MKGFCTTERTRGPQNGSDCRKNHFSIVRNVIIHYYYYLETVFHRTQIRGMFFQGGNGI